MTVKDISDYLDSIFPYKQKMDFDNVGLLCGFPDKNVSCVLLSLDITEDVIDEALQIGAELIITHHPVIFKPIKTILTSDPIGKRIIKLLSNNISVISLHTNLDVAVGGVNDELCKTIGLTITEMLPCGRICTSEYSNLQDLSRHVSEKLSVNGLKYYDSGAPVGSIAVCSGAGGDLIYEMIDLGCNTLISGELKYNQWLDAKDMHINVIEADHFCMETIVLPKLESVILSEYPSITTHISSYHKQTANII